MRHRASLLNLKQHQVAEALGVSRSFISELYAGRKRGLSFSQLSNLCSLLGTTSDELLGRRPMHSKLTEIQIKRLLSEIETDLRIALDSVNPKN